MYLYLSVCLCCGLCVDSVFCVMPVNARCTLHKVQYFSSSERETSKNQNETMFFRKDYTLYSEVATFYKLHTDPKPWNEARKNCILEGSTLAVPKTAAEAEIYRKVMGDHLGSFVEVSLGIQAFSKGLFTTLDGTLIANIYHNWGPGEPNDVGHNEDCVTMNLQTRLNDVPCDYRFPFICEKSQNSVKWNNDCQIADPDYRRLDKMDHCYKLHLKPKNWPDAYATCIAEQSYLAILNSEEESKALKQLYEVESGGKVNGGNEIIHLGFHDRYKEGEFTTIEGMSLNEAGFDIWSTGQPDHPGEETCGSMSLDGKLNDVNCGVRAFFICELENNSALSVRHSN